MDEREMLTYFDIVDLVDKILPPKSEFDYTKVTVAELLERFDSIINEGGYHFREEFLVECHRIIANYQKFNYGRTSNFVGGENAEYFDQNNYGIQNRLSQMRTALIGTLAKPLNYEFRGEVFDTFALGGTEKIKPRITKEEVQAYVTEVLTSTWEERDTLRLEEYALANDILTHFGIRQRDTFGSPATEQRVADIIGRMEFKSRDFYGPIDREGNYERSETSKTKHPGVLKETIDAVAGFVYQKLQDIMEKTEIREARRNEERRPKAKKGLEEILQESKNPTDVEVLPPEKKEPAPVSLEELEETRDKYEEVQAIAKENAELAQELEELKKKAAEIQAKIQSNNDRMIKALQKK